MVLFKFVKRDYSKFVKRDYSKFVKRDYSKFVKRDYSKFVKERLIYTEGKKNLSVKNHTCMTVERPFSLSLYLLIRT